MSLYCLRQNKYVFHIAHTRKCQGIGGADVKTFPCDVCEKLFLSNRERVLHICNRETLASLKYLFSLQFNLQMLYFRYDDP